MPCPCLRFPPYQLSLLEHANLNSRNPPPQTGWLSSDSDCSGVNRVETLIKVFIIKSYAIAIQQVLVAIHKSFAGVFPLGQRRREGAVGPNFSKMGNLSYHPNK
jgi:hypothetical protein